MESSYVTRPSARSAPHYVANHPTPLQLDDQPPPPHTNPLPPTPTRSNSSRVFLPYHALPCSAADPLLLVLWNSGLKPTQRTSTPTPSLPSHPLTALESHRVSLFGLINLKAPYFPFALVLLDLIQGGPGYALQAITGIVAAHAYFLLLWYVLPCPLPPSLPEPPPSPRLRANKLTWERR